MEPVSRQLSAIGRGIVRTQTDVPSVAALLVHFDGRVERSRVVECFDKRVLPHHLRMSHVLDPTGRMWIPSLVTSDSVILDDATHLAEWSDVEAHISHLQSLPLDCTSCLWDMRLFQYRHETLGFFRWHHACGDGMSMGLVWASMAENFEMPVRHVSVWNMVKLILWIVTFGWLVALRFIWLFVAYPRQPEVFNVPVKGPQKYLAVTEAPILPLHALQAKRSLGTLNDVVMCAINRAIATQTRDYDAHIAATMAVNIRFGADAKPVLRNLIGSMAFFMPSVNPTQESFDTSLARISHATINVKRWPEAYVSALMLVIMSNLLPVTIAKKAIDVFSSRVKLTVSNVAGSPFPLELFGAKAKTMMGFVPPPQNVPVGIGVLTYNGGLHLSVSCAASFPLPPRQLLDAIIKELQSNLQENKSSRK